MSLVELDRRAVRLAFERAAAGYAQHAVLQAEVEQRLLERLGYFQREPATILDVGCGTGIASHALKRQFPEALVVALDWSMAMLQEARSRQSKGPRPRTLCADMQALPLPARSFGLVFSNLAMQWSPDLAQTFADVRRVLEPGGLFLFTSFGPDTLHELRSAWAEADDRPHVNLFPDMHDVGDLLVAAGLVDPVMDMELMTLEYRDVKTLMRELKAIGAHNAAVNRHQGLTGKGKLRRVLEAYERFRSNGRYPASYEVVYGAAFGPAEGQPFRTAEGETAVFPVESLRRRRRGGTE